MRWLLPRVTKRESMTYGEIAAALEIRLNIRKIFSIHVGHVAGHLMNDILEIYPDAPLLNALVVDGSGVPGKGITYYQKKRFGRNYSNYKKLPIKKKRLIFERAAQEVFLYDRWDEIYSELYDMRPPARPKRSRKSKEEDGKSPDGRKGGGGEKPPHKRLKYYVKDNSHEIGLKLQNPNSEVEASLLSGDTGGCIFRRQKANCSGGS